MTYFPKILATKLSRGYGYVSGGASATLSSTERYDDEANTWSLKANINTGIGSGASFSLNSYGYSAGGSISGGSNSAIVERYDDIDDTWTVKTSIVTSKNSNSGFSLNKYGYYAGGEKSGVIAVTEQYDDVANTWTAKTSINTARYGMATYSLSGYGYCAGGWIAAASAVTEKYDDINNTWTARTNLNTARGYVAGFELHAYGYTVAGDTAARSQVTEQYDDINNTWTAKTNISVANKNNSGLSLNNFGYSIAGSTPDVPSTKTEKYDNISNSWTTKGSLNTARQLSMEFVLGAIVSGVQEPDLIPITYRINRETKTTDATASRAINGTVYTNTSSYNLFVTVSAACVTTILNDNSYMQAFSDTAADPATAVSGIVGIESGLAGEKSSVQMSFIVRPYEKYKITQTLTAGSTITIGKWFETTLK